MNPNRYVNYKKIYYVSSMTNGKWGSPLSEKQKTYTKCMVYLLVNHTNLKFFSALCSSTSVSEVASLYETCCQLSCHKDIFLSYASKIYISSEYKSSIPLFSFFFQPNINFRKRIKISRSYINKHPVIQEAWPFTQINKFELFFA